jgi:hypothetical protein
MSQEILPVSHCKFCKELAEDCECKRDRLLREKEIKDIICLNVTRDCEDCNYVCCGYGRVDESEAIARTQLAKADKEWVEWVEKTFYPPANWSDFDYEVWKKRKKEIGL